MKTREEICALIRREQATLVERYGVRVTALFGSWSREEQRQDSDLDLLADIVRPISLFELVGAQLHLEDVLGMKVDLIPQRSVRKELKEAIFRDAIVV